MRDRLCRKRERLRSFERRDVKGAWSKGSSDTDGRVSLARLILKPVPSLCRMNMALSAEATCLLKYVAKQRTSQVPGKWSAIDAAEHLAAGNNSNMAREHAGSVELLQFVAK